MRGIFAAPDRPPSMLNIRILKWHSTASREVNLLSFYKLTNLPKDSLEKIRTELHHQFSLLGVLGRVYISTEGINAQVSVPNSNEQKLKHFVQNYNNQCFSGILFNEAVEMTSSSESPAFCKLKVKLRDQIVADGLDDGSYRLDMQPDYLEPEEFHRRVYEMQRDPRQAVLLDVRNSYEMDIGHFKGHLPLRATTFRESLSMYRDECLKDPKKPILMYCTGGIRCSKAGAYLKSHGMPNVSMLQGGIINYAKYIKKNGIESLFIGKNYTFDNRLGERITEDVLGKCSFCRSANDDYRNCQLKACNALHLACDSCYKMHNGACSSICETILASEELRTAFDSLGSKFKQSPLESVAEMKGQ